MKTILLLLGMLVTLPSFPQDDQRTLNFGLTFSSFGTNDLVRFSQLDGDASYSSGGFEVFGITYLRTLNPVIDLETGLEYSIHRIIVTPNVPPLTEITPYTARPSMVIIPITLRYYLGKYFFINGGPIFSIDASLKTIVHNQNGLGAMAGAGLQYTFNFEGTVFINPYFKAHTLLPFSSKLYYQRLLEAGIRVGFVYPLFRMARK